MKLQDYLIKKGIDAKTFAADAQIPYVTFWRILTGKTTPKLQNIEKIHKATKGKVSYRDFLPNIIP